MAKLGLGLGTAGTTGLSESGAPTPSATLTINYVTLTADHIYIEVGYTTNVTGKISVFVKDLSAVPQKQAEDLGNAVSATTGTVIITFATGDLVGGALTDLDSAVAFIVPTADTDVWGNRFAQITQAGASWTAWTNWPTPDGFDITAKPSSAPSEVLGTYVWNEFEQYYRKDGTGYADGNYLYKATVGASYGWFLYSSAYPGSLSSTSSWQYTPSTDVLSHQGNYTHGNVVYD